jgi:glycine cleavage system regulatory protein
MKFGNYLDERKSHLPKEYAENCIDYNNLKAFLKSDVYSYSIKLENTQQKQQPFAQLVSERLGQLQKCEVVFIEKLDSQVERATKFFETESAALVNGAPQVLAGQSVEATTDLLKKIVTLERFVFLNYTGVTKILKKNDRHSGLSLSEPYLQRVAALPLVKAEALTQLKLRVMNKLNEQHAVDPTTIVTSPIMVRSRSSRLNPSTVLPPTFIGPNQKVLVSLSGPHGTDIVGAVLDCLARHPCDIDDFMLSRLYHNVTFGVLITLQSDNVAIFRDLAEAAQKWDATLTYDIPDSQATEPLIREQKEKNKKENRSSQPQQQPVYIPASLEEAPYSERVKYAATLLNQNGLNSTFLSEWTRLLLKHRISVEKLIRLNKNHDVLSCADLRLSVPRGMDMSALRTELIGLSTGYGTDIAFQRDDVFRKNKRLVVFDMDSTLIYQEVIDEIARHAGVVDQVSVSTL